MSWAAKHVVKNGTTPVLEGVKWRKLLDSIPTATLRDLREPRITAPLKMKSRGSPAPLFDLGEGTPRHPDQPGELTPTNDGVRG